MDVADLTLREIYFLTCSHIESLDSRHVHAAILIAAILFRQVKTHENGDHIDIFRKLAYVLHRGTCAGGGVSGNDVNRIAICSVVVCFLYIGVDGAVIGLDIYVFNAGYVYLGLVVINREIEEA